MSEEDEAAGPRLAEEIRLLVEMVVEKAAPWLEGVVAAGHGDPDEAKPDASACGWCPLCAIVAVVRGERPELAARCWNSWPSWWRCSERCSRTAGSRTRACTCPGSGPRRGPPADDMAVSPRVQHITVRRRDEWRPDRES